MGDYRALQGHYPLHPELSPAIPVALCPPRRAACGKRAARPGVSS